MQLKIPKGANIKLSQHLSSSEVDCKCKHPECQETLVDTSTIALFELIREVLQGPVTVNSWYRCPAHNKEVKGEEKSKHMEGVAFDCTPSKGRWTPNQAAAIRFKLADYGGLGTYTDGSGRIIWLHIDSAEKRNWTIKV